MTSLPQASSGFPAIERALHELGWPPDRCAGLLVSVTEEPASQQRVLQLRDTLRHAGVTWTGDLFERVLLSCAVTDARAQLPSLRVYDGVKQLLARQLDIYRQPASGPHGPVEAGTYAFAVAAKTVSLRRFPAGPFDWELHGFRRSSLLKVPAQDLPRTLAFLAFRFRGFRPAFFMHVALPPRNRALVVEAEVRKAYYRAARSLALQPEMKGLLAAAWFHDPAALKDNPHLGPLNEPYLRHGGFITTLGPADEASGVFERNLQRRQQHAEGKLSYKFGLAVWPRRAAIQWADAHPELADV